MGRSHQSVGQYAGGTFENTETISIKFVIDIPKVEYNPQCQYVNFTSTLMTQY
jgi:hypothetical protein